MDRYCTEILFLRKETYSVTCAIDQLRPYFQPEIYPLFFSFLWQGSFLQQKEGLEANQLHE